ncbi:hypothetical protein B9Q12_02490 [Candidatus Marsarchaeota G2 archaeon ECH_B_SAG-G06]|uniref:Acyl-CoA dehydrogenase n=1 Tax=Candidatus Marsarchaeota G2 archaeon ECH_B_SAG-G06 TaxID=1978166 RepID=A0A2R6C0K4_9ARCH|nr:MAG: hypothetical protein B9Q12_02490 [Candidatus Marsarchaeota G2 archaeon ECH_B_SAG-G06]
MAEVLQTILNAFKEATSSFDEAYWINKDRSASFPSEYLSKLRELELTAMLLPQSLGGAGLSLYDYLKLVRLSSSMHGVEAGDLLMAYNVFGSLVISNLKSEKLAEKFSKLLIEGVANPCVAITEPQAGVDTFSINTQAEYKNGEYTIRGKKIWITMAANSRLMTVLCRTSKNQKRSFGLTAFVLDPSEHKEVKFSRINDIALRSLGSYEVFFDDVKVGEEAILGERDKGWEAITRVLNAERLSTAAIACGVSDLLLKKATWYASNRVVFGRPIGSNQAIQFPLALCKACVEAAWRLVIEGAKKFEKGENAAFEANASALLASKTAYEVSDIAMQVFGGMSFAVETGIELHWRNARLLRVGPVPEQMALSFIAHNVLGLPRSF